MNRRNFLAVLTSLIAAPFIGGMNDRCEWEHHAVRALSIERKRELLLLLDELGDKDDY